VRYTGYVDYARNCSSGAFENAWMLTHACDQIDHDPAFPRGGSFHPDRAYTFVGPAAGFVPGPVQPFEAGGSPLESIRRWKVPVPGTTGPVTCEFEEPVVTAILNPLGQGCLTSPGPGQYAFADLFVSAACGSAVSPTPGTVSFLSMGIGSWTNPTVYPGIEVLRWSAGDYRWFDPCTGVQQSEVFFGVTTLGGFQADQHLSTGPGQPLPLSFIDQCNSILVPGSAVTRNIPFVSDHLISLNLP
jgi:hypothetical protein